MAVWRLLNESPLWSLVCIKLTDQFLAAFNQWKRSVPKQTTSSRPTLRVSSVGWAYKETNIPKVAMPQRASEYGKSRPPGSRVRLLIVCTHAIGL